MNLCKFIKCIPLQINKSIYICHTELNYNNYTSQFAMRSYIFISAPNPSNLSNPVLRLFTPPHLCLWVWASWGLQWRWTSSLTLSSSSAGSSKADRLLSHTSDAGFAKTQTYWYLEKLFMLSSSVLFAAIKVKSSTWKQGPLPFCEKKKPFLQDRLNLFVF